ncbi:MAG: hypothetical protein ABSF69_06960 [Polyangiaceae bacterium]
MLALLLDEPLPPVLLLAEDPVPVPVPTPLELLLAALLPVLLEPVSELLEDAPLLPVVAVLEETPPPVAAVLPPPVVLV